MRQKLILLAGLFFLLSAFKADEKSTITIFMIGDSTMANKVLTGGNLERGWGQMLPGFFSENIQIDNHAVNGRSSKSFIDEGRWEQVISQVKKGDYVFIQFGHNDEKPDVKRHTDPGGTFDVNLRRFVNETRAKGGIPVLFNSIVRRNFGGNTFSAVTVKEAVQQDDFRNSVSVKEKRSSEDSITGTGEKLIDTHGAYLDSPRNVAEELNVPFVDMNKITHDLVEGMGPVESKKLYMWVPANEVLACPKGREDNTHLNIHGARLITGLTVDAIAKAVLELAQYIRHYDFVVAKDGSGDFFSIQEAINAVPDFRKNVRTTILVRKGVYKEKIVVPESKINISLIGQDGAILSYDDYANKPNLFGENKGTSGSSSCYIYAPDFYAENITFENTSGPVGQAVACFVSADRVYFKNCRFLGFQDTLYTYGKDCRQYYEDCYIEGTVDFIFGWSTAVFNRCHIHSKGDGYVTAPSTDRGQKYGYVFYDCTLTADGGVKKVYLSRPWRPYAQAVFIRCKLGKHIAPEGWNNWDQKDTEKTVFYAEYKSSGEGANPKARVSFSHQLKNLKGYEMDTVLAGNDGWNPIKSGNRLLNIKR
ncbi:MAG: pectinesterase family protein [Bacteroides sp.]|jgi:pectinesterase|nr:pectinesterase family protein [Bacteroides sp.]MCI1681023.1 pectinesterase family protein [Bacteroides sp.]